MKAVQYFVFAFILTQTNLALEPLQATKPYDSYVLATEWAGSVCTVKRCQYNTGSTTFWNMHGLWPNSDNGRHPFSCASTSVDIQKLPQNVQSDLNKYWAGLFASQSGFIAHEWSKHGTCWDPYYGDLSKMPSILTQIVTAGRKNYDLNDLTVQPVDYLNLVMNLGKVYSLYDAFKEFNILPSDARGYQKSEIQAAIAQKFNGVTKYNLICQKDRKTGRSLIYEIRLCLNKSFNVVDCSRSGNSCARTVYYPVNRQ